MPDLSRVDYASIERRGGTTERLQDPEDGGPVPVHVRASAAAAAAAADQQPQRQPVWSVPGSEENCRGNVRVWARLVRAVPHQLYAMRHE